ncbi:DUF1330 domain-containing protein [Nakamurella flava]|uniref:DUF1330 domain-containing protein n=1 Tax=Nakamurella flava TaxID=2576308 RepID=A0A4U6QNH8_9ACTN|nr:DUF1330 domain-containing protein [Nakamurella flava]TKV61969.1 DUF1330 domain-containing protein [Nakamurella flava]
MKLELCVLLWAVEDQEQALTDYENQVLALLPRHGGVVISRVRRIGGGSGPTEVQVIHLPDDSALHAFIADPERLALADEHRRSVAKTEVLTVRTIV